ncbi:hypothetical protein [Streptomyces marincola]|uniref:hypothetical protein n=1 Tax=Streptomyces marincola TaxID=2878388 RepID=UPI001CF48081|nr:hypothetical protein [Streptomyces marincola]UCM91627.1 hypothetical protein LC193_28775 [Streptomyces marincola]
MPRNTREDFSNSIGMLHSTVTDMRSEMRTMLREGFDGVTNAGERAHHDAAEAVNAELSRMRTDVRATQKGVLAREDIGNVQRTLDLLRDDIQVLKERLMSPSAAPAEAPSAPVSGQPRSASWSPDVSAHSALSLSPPPVPQAGEDPSPTQPAPTLEQISSAVLAALRDELRPLYDLDFGNRLAALQETTDTTARDLLSAEAEREHVRSRISSLAQDVVALPTREEVAEQVGALASEIAALTETCRAAATREDITEQISPLADQIAALTVTSHVAVPRPADAPSRTAPEQAEDPHLHRERLRRAASVSTARLVSHRDIWEFLTSQAARHPHFRMPPQIADHGDHRIAATLSGRSLIALLITLRGTRHSHTADDGDWALAATAYDRIAAALDDLAPEGGPVTITLDDRTPSRSPVADDTSTATDETSAQRWQELDHDPGASGPRQDEPPITEQGFNGPDA